MTVNELLDGFTVLDMSPACGHHGPAVNVSQRDTGGVRSIARWRLIKTQQADDHEGNLLFLRGAVSDHG